LGKKIDPLIIKKFVDKPKIKQIINKDGSVTDVIAQNKIVTSIESKPIINSENENIIKESVTKVYTTISKNLEKNENENNNMFINKKNDNNDNILNSLQGMSKIFFTQQNTENNCEINSNHQFNFNTFNSQNNYQNMNVNASKDGINLINNNNVDNKLENHINIKINQNHNLGFKNKQFNDPRKIYHSPSPLNNIKKNDSKIIEENKNVNNQINFDEEQRIFNN
jgi:hypothetical protein